MMPSWLENIVIPDRGAGAPKKACKNGFKFKGIIWKYEGYIIFRKVEKFNAKNAKKITRTVKKCENLGKSQKK